MGGQVDPSSIVGDNLVWKNAQKNDTKNNTSDTINKIIRHRNPFVTIFVCNPWYVQMKYQLDATLCRFYFCRVTLHVSGASAHHQEYLKLVRRPLVHVLTLQVSHHISGPIKEM